MGPGGLALMSVAGLTVDAFAELEPFHVRLSGVVRFPVWICLHCVHMFATTTAMYPAHAAQLL